MGVGLRHLRESLVCECERGYGGKGWGWRLTFPCERENMGTRILNLSVCQQRGEKKVNQLTSTRRDGFLQGVGGGHSESLSSILTLPLVLGTGAGNVVALHGPGFSSISWCQCFGGDDMSARGLLLSSSSSLVRHGGDGAYTWRE